MTNSDHPGLGERSDATRVVTCDMAFLVSEPTEVVVQVVASRSAGQVDDARFEVLTDGERPSSLVEVHDPEGATLHVIRSIPGPSHAELPGTDSCERSGPPREQP